MSYADDNGQGECGYQPGQFVVVEGSQIAGGASAAYYHYAVVIGLLGIDVAQRLHHRGYGAFALHDGWKKSGGEPQPQAVGV